MGGRVVAVGALCILTAAALAGRQVGADGSDAAQTAPAADPPITYRVVVEDGTVTRVVPRLGPESGPVISGLVMDPRQRGLEEVILMLGRVDGHFSPIPIAPDGSFVTPPLNAGTYVLQLVRTPHSVERRATVVGFRIVDVGTSDVSGITVDVRRETAIRGRFRMESDNPAAAWVRFSLPLLPGEYRVNAVPETTFPSYDAASKSIFRFPHPEVTIVTLDEWEVETVSLTLRER